MNEPELLDTAEALDAAFTASHEQPVFVFKHSLVCPISSAAWSRFARFARVHPEGARFLFVEIQKTRPLSNAVAQRTGVRHESPQALLLREGVVVWHASHGGITESTLAEALAR